MLSGVSFQMHDDMLPTLHISPRLINAAADKSLGDNDSTTASKDGLNNEEDLSYDDYLWTKFGCDDFLPLEDDTLTDDAGIGIVEIVSPMEYINRLMLLRSEMGPSLQWCVNTNLPMLPESSRDSRYNGNLYWHDYYHMSELPATLLPPMRHVHCGSSNGLPCFHKARPMLQIFYIKLMTYLQGVDTPVKIYGYIAVRDSEDYHRNYLFNRPQSDPLTVNSTSDYLPLMSPTRGISMAVDCLIEVDIRVVGQMEDTTLVDGCSDLIERCCRFDAEVECTMNGIGGDAIFDFVVFRRALEATIHLDFLMVPAALKVKMCGYTSVSKSLYSFIGEHCDCDGSIISAGKFRQYFVAAVPLDDTLFIDFMEGNLPIPFKAAIHGSQEKQHHFKNNAVVSVKVCWSTAFN